MGKHDIGKVGDLLPGARKIVDVKGHSIGVFNVHDSFYALRNLCPLQGGPLCLRSVKGTMVASEPYTYEYKMDGQIIACPWHCWEFDITTGRPVYNPHRMRVKIYQVTVEIEEEPAVESFEVTVENELIALHV